MDKNIFKIKSDYPLLIPIKSGSNLHMVLVKKVKKRYSILYDPMFGIMKINNEKLKDIWNGEYLEVVNITGSNFHLKKESIIPSIYTITTVFFEILSFILLLTALNKINNDSSIYLVLSLFVGYILSDFIYRKFLILSMKKFDKKIFSDDNILNQNNFKYRYSSLTKFKMLSISNPIELISTLLITIFGSVVLGINNYFNLFIVIIICLINIIFKIIEDKKICNKKNKIDNIENNLLNSCINSNIEFKKQVNLLNKETYNYVNYLNFKKYITTFLLIISSLLFSYINKVQSLNFMLFHFFFYMYLNDNIVKLLNFDQNLDKIKSFKALYFYYFSKS